MVQDEDGEGQGAHHVRPVVKLHTIEQWFQVDPSIRVEILKALQQRDRLYTWLRKTNEHGDTPNEVLTVPCRECGSKGTVTVEPRYAGLHPSQLGHACLLRTWFDMKGFVKESKTESRQQITFDIGKAVHKMFQGYGERGAWGPGYKKESPINLNLQKLAEDLMIEGSADGEIVVRIDDIPNAPIFEVGIVHEYKSSNDNVFKGVKSPKPQHKQQAQLYAVILNRPVVVYFYLNKNDSNLIDFPVPFDPALWEVLYKKTRYFIDSYESNTQPPGEYGFHCQDCPFQYACETYKQNKKGKRA